MARKTKAYVDTSAFIAFLDRSDSYHPLFRLRFGSAVALATSALTVAEGHGWFLRRYDQRRAAEFLAFIAALKDVLRIRPFDQAALKASEAELRRYPDQRLTLADAHGLALMGELGVAECWSTDWHMGLGGAKLAIHQSD